MVWQTEERPADKTAWPETFDPQGLFMSTPTRDDFAALLDETLGGAAAGGFEGRVVKGTITAIENDKAVIDVGLKSEGRVALREFAMAGQPRPVGRR
jgi:hypothetical protein